MTDNIIRKAELIRMINHYETLIETIDKKDLDKIDKFYSIVHLTTLDFIQVCNTANKEDYKILEKLDMLTDTLIHYKKDYLKIK